MALYFETSKNAQNERVAATHNLFLQSPTIYYKCHEMCYKRLGLPNMVCNYLSWDSFFIISTLKVVSMTH